MEVGGLRGSEEKALMELFIPVFCTMPKQRETRGRQDVGGGKIRGGKREDATYLPRGGAKGLGR